MENFHSSASSSSYQSSRSKVNYCLVFITVLFFAVMSNQAGYAQKSYTSKQGGSFSSNATWAGGLVPPAGSNVIIKHAVTLSADQKVNNLTVSSTGALTIQSNLSVTGDILNSGKVFSLGTLSFVGTKPQYITNYVKKGIFWNALKGTAANAHFKNLVFNNPSKPIAVTFNFGNGLTQDGAVGVSGRIDFINGIVDIGVDNQFIVRSTSTATRVNGGLLRGVGKNPRHELGGQLGKEYPAGPSSYTYHIYDNVGTYDYSPVTLTFKSNNVANRVISIDVLGKAHPYLNAGARQKDYLNRYWWLIASGLQPFDATLTFNYLPTDVVGNKSNLKLTRWNGSSWNQQQAPASGNTFSVHITSSSWARGTRTDITARGSSIRLGRDADSEAIESGIEGKITVYPNPVVGRSVNVQFGAMPAGKYAIAVYNRSGQQVYYNQANHGGGTSSQSINLPDNLASGIYTLIVNDGQKQITQQNLLVADN